ncbi:MAG: hypothetical protein ACI85O_002433 [Saprospiraceae bacterium]|jgi:hypothetical protein
MKSLLINDSASYYKKSIEVLNTEFLFWKSSSLEDFITSSTKITVEQIPSNNDLPFTESKDFTSVENYLLSGYDDLVDKMPFDDSIDAIYAILIGIPDEWEIVQDFTSLIESGYIEEDYFDFDSDVNFEQEEKIIILTEGSTDVNVLKPSLDLLYPHLSTFYKFVDFAQFNQPGSASNLILNLKNFASTGIKNKIIALFDNDTAAEEALSSIKNLKFPDNIKIMHYPPIELGDNYPTIGPSGVVNLNINGLAGSIELYTGQDILKDENGDYIPVQWKGYSTKLEKYQGELINKREIQSNFKNKIKEAVANKEEMKSQDWKDIDSILRQIFDAF